MNMKLAFKAILRDFGHDIFLQRRQSGGGFNNTLEKFTARHTHKSSLTQAQHERLGGVVHDFDMLFYVEDKAHPKEGDRIYQHDERYNPPQTTWIVDFAQPMRGARGEVVFYSVGCTREVPL